MPSAKIGIELTGDKELAALLSSLPGNVINEVKIGIKAVGNSIVKDARRRLKKGHGLDTGQLKKSLGVRAVKSYTKGNEKKVVMYLGPRRGFEIFIGRNSRGGFNKWRKHDPANIAHLVEFGHRQIVQQRGMKSASGWKFKLKIGSGQKQGEQTGRIEARPFLRPAVDAKRGEFIETMKAQIRKVLSKRIKTRLLGK